MVQSVNYGEYYTNNGSLRIQAAIAPPRSRKC